MSVFPAMSHAHSKQHDPPMSGNALAYAWQQLAFRAGIGEQETVNADCFHAPVPVWYRLPEQCPERAKGIYIVPAPAGSWRKLVTLPSGRMQWLSANQAMPPGKALPLETPVPALLWGEGYEDGNKPFAARHDSETVVFYVDLLSSALFMLTRWEESMSHARDQHDRFPAVNSVAFRQSFLDRPLIDEYALILQAWIKALLPEWTPQPLSFSVKLSHDIDFVCATSWRRLGGDLFKRRSLSLARKSLSSMLVPEKDPYVRGCYELADLSETHDFQSAFYFMAAKQNRFDIGYDPQGRRVQRLIKDLRKRGHEIGFHPGYTTPEGAAHFMAEKRRMDTALGETCYGGRQHYLRFAAPQTWRLWEAAGLAYDSTLGYADHEGFRCGTCQPFHPFDIEQDRQLDLLEIPLLVMDSTLKNYRKLSPQQARNQILAIAKRCRQVNGLFTLLWHNTSLRGEWGPYAAIYRQVLPVLAKMEA